MDVCPDVCEVVVVEVACALPIEGGHWLLQEEQHSHNEAEARGHFHINFISVRLLYVALRSTSKSVSPFFQPFCAVKI